MDDHQGPEVGSGNLLQTDILGHDFDHSRAKRELSTEISTDTSETEKHSRKKRKIQPEDSEHGTQDGVAARSNVFNSSTTGNDDDITHSNADRSHRCTSNGMDTCLNRNKKPRCVLVCPEQDGTDDQETENYYDGTCHPISPYRYRLDYEDEQIRDMMTGSDDLLERGIIHFWRVEGNKDLAHFALRALDHFDYVGVDEDTFACFEGPLLTLVEKRWPKDKSDKVMCVVEKRYLMKNELEEYMSTVAENPDRIAAAAGLYAIVSNSERSHLAYHILSATRGKGSKSLSSLGVRIKGSFVCWAKNPKASGTDIDKPRLYWKWLQEKFRGLLWTPLQQEHLVMEGTKILLIRGDSKNEKVKENNSEDKLNDAGMAAKFEKELMELDYASLDIAPLEDDHPIFDVFETVKDDFAPEWHPWDWMRST